jgi:lipoprotein Spr
MTALSSCRTTTPKVDYRALAKASVKIEMDIEYKDNHVLYTEVSGWLGTPYRSGGSSKSGTDCSGLATQIYRKVYHIRLPRTSDAQYNNGNKVSKSELREGDLVFFTSSRSGKKVAHSGIYLKNEKFIHASSSQGVIISSLNEDYYRKYWKSGGRYK